MKPIKTWVYKFVRHPAEGTMYGWMTFFTNLWRFERVYFLQFQGIRIIAKQFHLKSPSFNIHFTWHGRRSELLNLAVTYTILANSWYHEILL